MTVEKAIEILECHRVSQFGGMHGEILSVSEIIDLLRGISTEEGSVSRQELTITNNKVHLCDSCQYTYVTCPSHGDDAIFGDGKGNDNICACNKYLPICAEPEQKPGKWILCSEGLPEDSQFVLMTIRRMGERYNHEPFISIGYISWNKSVWWCAHDGDCKSHNVRVDAWMPLPKPYAERRQDG